MYSKNVRPYHYNSPVGGALRQAWHDAWCRSVAFTMLTLVATTATEVYCLAKGLPWYAMYRRALGCAVAAETRILGRYLPAKMLANESFGCVLRAGTVASAALVWWAVHRLLGRGRVLPGRLYHQRVDGKTLVVTGANVGLGFECARHWALRGGHVVLCARDINRGVAARDRIIALLEARPLQARGSVEFLQLDLSAHDSIRAAAGKLSERNIAVLMNNAGVAGKEKPAFTHGGHGVAGQELQLGTNHIGHFLFTALLLPALKRSGGRVVNVASLAHLASPAFSLELFDQNYVRRHYSPLAYYGLSKTCNILFTKQLQKVIDKDASANGLSVYACHPGVVATALTRDLGKIPANPLKWPGALLEGLLTAFTRVHSSYVSEGAATQLYLALEDKRALQPAQYYSQLAPAPTTAQCNDAKHQADLWVYSARATGLATSAV